jgi:hypothetical protein
MSCPEQGDAQRVENKYFFGLPRGGCVDSKAGFYHKVEVFWDNLRGEQ